MIEPPEQPPSGPPATGGEPAADPFEPGPAHLSGCSKPAVVGCLVVLALLAVSLVLLVSQSQRLMRFVMEQMRSDVTAALPADLPETERQRLDAAFDAAIAAVMEGRFDYESLTGLQRLAELIPRRGETLSGERVREISELLEALGAVGAPAAGPPIAAAAGAAPPMALSP